MCIPIPIIAAGVSAVAGIAGSAMAASAAKKAAQTQADSAAANNNANRALVEKNWADNTALIQGAATTANDYTRQLREGNQTVIDGTQSSTQQALDAGVLAQRAYYDDARTQADTQIQGTLKNNSILNQATYDKQQAALAQNKAEVGANLTQTRDANQGIIGSTKADNTAVANANTGLAVNDITSGRDAALGALSAAQGKVDGYYSPYLESGSKATSQIEDLLGIGGDAGAAESAFNTWKDATGYQFNLAEGQKGLVSDFSQMGGLESGAAQKAIARYNQNLADQTFQSYMGNLQGLSAQGLQAASGAAGSTTNIGLAQGRTSQDAGMALARERDNNSNLITAANNLYQLGMVDTNNQYSNGLVNNLNQFLNGTMGVESTYNDRQTGDNDSARDLSINAANNWASNNGQAVQNYTNNTTNNIGKAGDARLNNNNTTVNQQVQLLTNSAANLANINSGLTTSLVGGNNAANQQEIKSQGDIGASQSKLYGGITNNIVQAAGAVTDAVKGGSSGVNIGNGVTPYPTIYQSNGGMPSTTNPGLPNVFADPSSWTY